MKKITPNKTRNSNRLYQADEGLADHITKVRETLLPLCHQYRNHAVRVETIDGRSFEGIIVEVDAGHLYLQVTDHNRAFFPQPSPYSPYGPSFGGAFYPQQQPFFNNNVILPLVLFELLTIALI
jgi:hypothetical protein